MQKFRIVGIKDEKSQCLFNPHLDRNVKDLPNISCITKFLTLSKDVSQGRMLKSTSIPSFLHRSTASLSHFPLSTAVQKYVIGGGISLIILKNSLSKIGRASCRER